MNEWADNDLLCGVFKVGDAVPFASCEVREILIYPKPNLSVVE